MSRIADKLSSMVLLLKRGQFGDFVDQIKTWLYSDSYSYGLRRDITIPFAAPAAKIPIIVRPMQQEDISRIIDSVDDTTSHDRSWILSELSLLTSGIPTGYLATTQDDTPCYMQWLISSRDNPRIKAHFRAMFPWLNADETLLEGAYTLPAFRGQRIMSCAMAQIAERARDVGARWVITFVDHGNVASLKGCHYAGFEPYLIRRERYRLFRKSVTFEPMSDLLPYPIDWTPRAA